jgi:hypothetical protein
MNNYENTSENNLTISLWFVWCASLDNSKSVINTNAFECAYPEWRGLRLESAYCTGRGVLLAVNVFIA